MDLGKRWINFWLSINKKRKKKKSVARIEKTSGMGLSIKNMA